MLLCSLNNFLKNNNKNTDGITGGLEQVKN